MSSCKTCTICGELKAFKYFYKHSGHKDGYTSECKCCNLKKRKKNRLKLSERTRKYYYKNRKNELAKQKKRRTTPEGQEYYRKFWVKYRYGLSSEDWQEIFDRQNGCCPICGIHQSKLNQSLSVDHNHKTNEIRGLLCNKCNLAMGFLNVDESGIKLLQKAIKYVKKILIVGGNYGR